MSTTEVRRHLLVGVDGSDESSVAARWAVAEAERRGAVVVALLVWSYIDQPAEGFDPQFSDADADVALARFLADAVGSEAAAKVERRVVCDRPALGIVDAAKSAELVVVGARGSGGFAGLRLGSVADHVAQASTVPAVIVCAPGDPSGRVVVGYDGSTTSVAALEWAADAARARGVPLEIVHSWAPPVAAGWAFLPDAPMFEKIRIAAEHAGAAAAARVSHNLDVITTVREGSAAGQLVAATSTASLIVVGRRGLGGLAAIALGSVSRQVVHHASCPVVVVPPKD